MASCKKDAKGRKLGKGESYRSDGRYCYSYTICGERKWLYASDLAELRELERRIEHDKDDGIRTQEASKITLNDMFGTYIATKTKIKTSTRENYLYLWNKIHKAHTACAPVSYQHQDQRHQETLWRSSCKRFSYKFLGQYQQSGASDLGNGS